MRKNRPREVALLTGDDLVNTGMASGPAMGALLKKAWEAQLRGEVKSRDEALVWAGTRIDIQQD